jgi:type II secretory pathway component GspD/PulD (secretin)
VEWNFPQVTAGSFTSSDAHDDPDSPDFPYGISIGFMPNQTFTNALNLVLNMFAQDDQMSIIASPQIIAQDRKPAQMKVTTEEFFQIITPGSFYASADLEKVESGTTLDITPRIGQNGEVTLLINVEVSDVVARGENNLPVISRRTANSTVRLSSGGTAAIAGLMSSRTEMLNSRVPGASRIPVMGSAFKNKAAAKETKQLAIFITATTLENGDLAQKESRIRRVYDLVSEEEFVPALLESMQQTGL